jgi:hypothetical protein
VPAPKTRKGNSRSLPVDAVEAQRSALAARVGYITRQDWIALAKITASTEEAHRKRGDGPPHVRIGTEIFYSITAVREHLDAKAAERAAAVRRRARSQL